MALYEVISGLNTVELPEKQEQYLHISKLLSENSDSTYEGINNELTKSLYTNILDDLKKESELPQIAKLLHSLFHNKHLQKFFPDSVKTEIFKDAVNTIDSGQHESVLVNYFYVLILIPSPSNIENTLLGDLLQRMEDVISKKNEPASTHAVCNYFQKFLKDYEERLSDFIPLLSKLVFLPLCHPSNKVREIAEKNLDMFPKILLYSSDEQATLCLLKLLRETYSKDMLQLFKEKQETYVLKVWTHVVKALGGALSANLSSVTPFFQVIEKGFKSPVDEICIASFNAWKSLIDSFAGAEGVLNDSKRLRFVLKPFKNIARSNENILSVACDTWMHLVWNLGNYLSSRFSEVCIPLLELTVGKISSTLPEKIPQKGGPATLIKKSCYILLRLLELPPNESFNRLSSPKKLPYILYPALQAPLDIKIITHHFKEMLYVLKVIIDVCGSKEDMKLYVDCLLKSVLFIVSTVIEDSNKESAEAVNLFLNFLSDVIEAKICPSLLCLKCLESLSKLSRKILVSHCFNCGSRKPQDILCTSLLKLLLSPHLFPSEAPKRFLATYNRLVQAGIHESFHPLLNTHKFMHVVRSAIGANSFDVEVLNELWSSVASTLLEVIEKTQEVNQGDKQEHDFSCMYDVLLFPFEFIFPAYVQQFRTRPAVKLWTNMYKAFIRSASLVATTSANEACENFCFKLKNYVKEDILQKPYFMESFCSFMQSIMESIDFVSGGPSGNQGIVDVASMMKRKKPLGNLTSFVDLLVILLKAYHASYVEADEDSVQSSAPAIQRKVHIVKNAAPLDILKTYFGSTKSGSVISLSLEQLIDPIAKLFMKSSQKRNVINHNDNKLEVVWSVICSSVERYYLGPYDSEFLALMSPLLEATFSHPKRNIKEKSRRFWFATFGPNVSSLKFPDSLKNLLKKMKLPLLSDDISPTEFSISPMADSLPEDSIDVLPVPVPKPPPISQPFKSPVVINGEASKILPKDNKQSPKIPIDDLPSEEFVKIDSPVVSTFRRRNIRKKRSYIPTMYSDLSQDTATLMSSSESQDIENSSSLDQMEYQEPAAEIKENSVKELTSIPSSSHDVMNVSKTVMKSPMSAKFEEKLDQSLKDDHVISLKNVISAESSESDNKTEDKVKKKVETNAGPDQEKLFEKDTIGAKISVFSKPGEKQLPPRSTRRNAKLSQSFSALPSKKDSEKLEFQKLNKSCVELINLSDSEDIIPSSQGSGESENSIKVTVDNRNQKSHVSNNSNLNVAQKLPQVCLSPEYNKEIDGKDLVSEKLSFKIVTSTPSKSNIPTVIDGDMACKSRSETCIDLHEDKLSVFDLPDDSVVNRNKTTESSVEVNKEQKNVPPRVSGKCMTPEVQSQSEEVIQNLDFLLDAVDNLVSSTSIEPTNECDDKGTHHLELKTKIENASNSEIKTILATPSDVCEKISSPYEPIAKRSRLSLKLTESGSQNETYSQKLRKKNTIAKVKTQQKSKKVKIMKKDEITNKNSKIKSNKKAGSEQNKEPKQTCAEQKQEETVLLPEMPNDIESMEVKENCPSNLINEINIKTSDKSCDSVVINQKTNTQDIGNAESGEIFEAFSNSCRDSQNVDAEVTSVSPRNCLNTLETNKENKCGDLDSQANKTHVNKSPPHLPDKTSFDERFDSLVILPNDNVTAVTVIPSSLENDSSSRLSDKMQSAVLNDNSNIEDFHMHSIESIEEAEKSLHTENEVNIDPSSVEFSVIEDDLSCEMHHIINSVVIDSENSVNDNLSGNNSVAPEESTTVQKTKYLVKSSNEENLVSCDKIVTFDSSSTEQKENRTESSTLKERFNEVSNDCSDSCSSIDYNSCDVIMLSDSEDSSECSAQIVESTDDVISQNIDQNGEINSETKSDTIEELKVDYDSKNVTSALDHSYSVSKENHSDFSISQVSEKQSKNVNDVCDKLQNHIVENKEVILNLDHEIPDKGTLKSSECHYSNDEFCSSSPESEITCIIKDLVIKVEKLNYAGIESNCYSTNIENFVKSNVENVPADPNEAANKENEAIISSSNDKFAKGSKKRKIKPPIRSPFNFRQRGKMENSKKLSTKSVKSFNATQIKSIAENKDLVIKAFFPKDDLKEDDSSDSSMAKIISSIVDSISVEDDDMDVVEIPNTSASHMSKAQRVELSNDELTDLNTRLNAQIAHQTRRIKMIADSQIPAENENETVYPDAVNVYSDDPSSNLSSILKKRKSSGQEPARKVRRVTFASPLIHELVFESCTESRSITPITMNRIQNLNKKRKKILQEKNKTGKATSLPNVQPSVPSESEDIPSSSEYQDSDILDFSDLPVSPALINCPDDISNILKDLTSQSWIRGLESLLASRNIKTIGDVCKLNIHQVKALPFKSPKVVTLHKALMGYIGATQESTLQKIKTIDDGSFGEMKDSTVSSHSSECAKTSKNTENSEDFNNSTLLEETIKDLLEKDSLKDLPLNLLGQLIESCGKAIIEKNQQS